MAAVTAAMALKKTGSALGLFGSSMGGAACIHAWQALETVGFSPKGAVLCASPLISSTIDNIPTEANGNRPALPLSFFTENLLFDLTPSAQALHHVLIFHGDADEIVPVSNARLLYRASGFPKELVIHSKGRHRMDIPAHQKDFEKRAAAWFKKMFSAAP